MQTFYRLSARRVLLLSATLAMLSIAGTLSSAAEEVDDDVPAPAQPVSLVAILPVHVPPVSNVANEGDDPTVSQKSPGNKKKRPRRVGPRTEEERAYYLDVADQLRSSVYAKLKSLGTTLQLPSETDERLAALPQSATSDWLELSHETLRERLGADAVVLGWLREAKPGRGGVASEAVVDVVFEIVDIRDGETLWKDRIRRSIQTGLITNAVSLTGVAESLSVSEDDQRRDLHRLIDEVCRHIEATAPRVGVDERRLAMPPEISAVVVSPAPDPNQPDGPKLLQVGLRGSPNVTATFDLFHVESGTVYKSYLPLTESIPGVYSGEYIVHPGDPVGQTFQVIGRVTTQSGLSRTYKSLTRFKLGN